MERSVIMQLLQANTKDPFDGQEVHPEQLEPVPELKDQIAAYF